jgi:hypothetical protein
LKFFCQAPALKQIPGNQNAHRAARQNDESHSAPQQPNAISDEHRHPLIMPQLSYAGNLLNFGLI